MGRQEVALLGGGLVEQGDQASVGIGRIRTAIDSVFEQRCLEGAVDKLLGYIFFGPSEHFSDLRDGQGPDNGDQGDDNKHFHQGKS